MKDYSDYGIEIPHGRTSGNVKTYCPQCREQRHNKRDRSLSVNLNEGVWNCHYCGWSGRLEFTEEEKREWARQHSALQPNAAMPKEYRKPKPRPKAPMSDKALAWFAGRGIGRATVDEMRITEGMEFMPQHNK